MRGICAEKTLNWSTGHKSLHLLSEKTQIKPQYHDTSPLAKMILPQIWEAKKCWMGWEKVIRSGLWERYNVAAWENRDEDATKIWKQKSHWSKLMGCIWGPESRETKMAMTITVINRETKVARSHHGGSTVHMRQEQTQREKPPDAETQFPNRRQQLQTNTLILAPRYFSFKGFVFYCFPLTDKDTRIQQGRGHWLHYTQLNVNLYYGPSSKTPWAEQEAQVSWEGSSHGWTVS